MNRDLSDFVDASEEKQVAITSELVAGFAEAVGDDNPLHLDELAAAKSRFGRPIAHGMLVGSLFGGMIASDMPGPGSVYISQTLSFRKPVYVGTTATVRIQCVSIEAERRRLTLTTEVLDEEGAVCVTGEAVVLAPDLLE